MKRRDTRYLRRRIERVRVHSNADGTFTISPWWKEPYVFRPNVEDQPSISALRELPPGLFTRMETAEEIERHLNALLGAALSPSVRQGE